MNEDIELMKKELKVAQEGLAKTNLVLGTLIVWLQQELGRKNATDLMEQLNS